jgi:glycosyltransferase involved in cell wall biosynthesis
MKILVAHCVPRARTNGMSRMMGFLHDEVANKGHQVEYFCAEDVPVLPRLYTGFSRFVFPLAVLRHAARAAANWKPYDIINIHEPSGAPLVLWRHSLGNAKIVVTSHGVEQRNWEMRTSAAGAPEDRPSFKTRIVYPATLLWQAHIALRRADHVFCLNSEDRAHLMARVGRSAEDITRIYPAADPVFGANARLRDYSVCRTLLFAGTWLARKGAQDLVIAFSKLARERQGLQLTVLNPGVEETALLSQFPEDVRTRVNWRKTRSEQETAAAFEQADVFLLPSLFEGTPLTLIEAMWSGLPVVTTNVCGMRDVVRDGENGLLIPPRDPVALTASIARFLDDQTLRERTGRCALADAREKFQWRFVAVAVMESYLRVHGRSHGIAANCVSANSVVTAAQERKR